MSIKKLAYTILASCAIGVLAGPAQATLMLKLDAGGSDVVTLTNPGNFINYIGALGVWQINVSTGVSNAPGVDGKATLDLNSIDVSTGAGTLTITLSDDGFTTPNSPGSGATTQVGGGGWRQYFVQFVV